MNGYCASVNFISPFSLVHFLPHNTKTKRIEKKIEENEFENNFEVAKCIGCMYIIKTYIQSKYERESRREKNIFFINKQD